MPVTQQMKPVEQEIITAVNAHEREFGRSLPNGSFYKSIALDILRKYGLRASK